eukprot:7268940-Prymnesium_polylepis.1
MTNRASFAKRSALRFRTISAALAATARWSRRADALSVVVQAAGPPLGDGRHPPPSGARVGACHGGRNTHWAGGRRPLE